MVAPRSPRRVLILTFLAVAIIFTLTQRLPNYQVADYEKLHLPFLSHPSEVAKPAPVDASSPTVPATALETSPSQLLVDTSHAPPASVSDSSSAAPSKTKSVATKPTNVKEYLDQVLTWSRPIDDDTHFPPYSDYTDKDYDPNRWEEFPMNEAYYEGNGIYAAADKGRFAAPNEEPLVEPKPYLPYPDYNSPSWQAKWKGKFVHCYGPRGLPLNETDDQILKTYRMPDTFPTPFHGSFEAVGVHSDTCFERYGRYGPYGFGEDHTDVLGWRQPERVDWANVDWGHLQQECLSLNADRYTPEARQWGPMKPSVEYPGQESEKPIETTAPKEQAYHSRTAVLIRTWTGYDYTDNDIHAIRALVTELSLLSGGEYQVFLLVHVKDRSLNIFEDPELYWDVLKANVPLELRSIAVLWSEAIFPSWYPDVTDWQVYWHQFMCLQWFSETHPEFDYIWNWETDARYTGQHYHFFEQIASFARELPRKFLWERNKRFYFPAVHGTYEEFVNDTLTTVEKAAQDGHIPKPIWGPQPQLEDQIPLGPRPPHSHEADNFEWGVGEEADLITFLPIWDPVDTEWSYRNMIWNFPAGVHPVFTAESPAGRGFDHPSFRTLQRRVIINTVMRFSKRLLRAMHIENRAGRSMQAEMWPASVALHHGFKVVHAPHPNWSDREWPHPYSDLVFNADGGVPGAWTEKADSIYNHDREVNFKSWSWYYTSLFPRTLYRRWLGLKVIVNKWAEGDLLIDPIIAEENGRVGRMCLPGMLLHPVKKMGEDRY